MTDAVAKKTEASSGAAVARGCRFLLERQFSHGQFGIEVAADHERDGEPIPDPTVFATSVVLLNLAGIDDAGARTASRRAAAFLRASMHPPGVWRFWSDEHKWADVIPFDADDTSCAAMGLRAQGSPPRAGTVRALLANRRRDGLFYTWFVPHRGILPREPAYWRCALSAVKGPAQRVAFWRLTEAAPDDVDAVVCANVLALLGDRPETAATSAYLAEVVLAGREEDCDKWYRRPLAVHHAIARAAACAPSLAPARERAIARILEHRNGPRFGDGALDTALAVCALADWGYEGPELAEAADWIEAAQGSDGSWPSEIYYVGGPKQVTRWGSAEVSTAFCVRALAAVRGAASPVGEPERPLVSVIIPTWNRGDMVLEAARSVLAQTYEPLELIVVDDGSTDGTVARLRELAGVRVIEQDHRGPAAARNRGLAESRGEIVASLDSDDVWHPDFVSCGVEAMLAHDLDLTFSNWSYEDQPGSLLDRALALRALGRQPAEVAGEWRVLGPEHVRATFLDGCPAPSSSLLIRRSVLDGGWDERMRVGDDWHLLLTLAIRRPIRAGYSMTARWTKRVDGHNRFESLSAQDGLTALKSDRDELRRQLWDGLRPRERLEWLTQDARLRIRLLRTGLGVT